MNRNRTKTKQAEKQADAILKLYEVLHKGYEVASRSNKIIKTKNGR